jgi:hypothetical protein
VLSRYDQRLRAERWLTLPLRLVAHALLVALSLFDL